MSGTKEEREREREREKSRTNMWRVDHLESTLLEEVMHSLLMTRLWIFILCMARYSLQHLQCKLLFKSRFFKYIYKHLQSAPIRSSKFKVFDFILNVAFSTMENVMKLDWISELSSLFSRLLSRYYLQRSSDTVSDLKVVLKRGNVATQRIAAIPRGQIAWNSSGEETITITVDFLPRLNSPWFRPKINFHRDRIREFVSDFSLPWLSPVGSFLGWLVASSEGLPRCLQFERNCTCECEWKHVTASFRSSSWFKKSED